MRGAPPADDGEETLHELFWAITRRLRHTSAESLARWDITPSQARALRVLHRHGSMRLSRLSDHLHIAPRSVTEVVDDLEAKDLARRVPDPGDRRATMVQLTDRGKSTNQALHAAEAHRVFDRLTARERADLARLLRKLQDG